MGTAWNLRKLPKYASPAIFIAGVPRPIEPLVRGAAFCVLLLFGSGPLLGQAFSLVHEFSGLAGYPTDGLTRGSDGKLYGALAWGGGFAVGSIYSLTPDGAGGYTYADLYGIVPGDGVEILSSELFEAADGQLYGGSNYPDGGAIYRVDKSGNFAVVHTLHVATEGGYPSALIQPGGGDFYGVALTSGPANGGTAFRVDAAGNLTVLHVFAGPDGRSPIGPLLLASDGFLYGVTFDGGVNHRGNIYRMDFSGNVTSLHVFAGSDGSRPEGGLIEASDGFLYGTTSLGGAFDRGVIFRMDQAGAFTTLHSFSPAEGWKPHGRLFEASDGQFYGTTDEGGAAGGGTLFRVNAAGVLVTLHEFLPAEGTRPRGTLLEDGGQLLGTAFWDGAYGYGTAFAASLSGAVQFVQSFPGAADGNLPVAGLIQGSDGLLYGTASSAGEFGRGTVFRLDLAGALTRLHSFDGATDGGFPVAPLIEASDGNLYGTASAEGAGGRGTVFRSSTAGVFATLHSFSGADGDSPYAGLIQATDGDFYGTTYAGGSGNLGTAFRIGGAGMFATLHEFTDDEGRGPSGLLLAPDGDFYGTTVGGTLAPSMAFRMDSSGSVSPVHAFGEAGSSGNGLLLASDGNFYGTNLGSVFRIDPAGNFAVIHSFGFPDAISYPGDLIEGTDGNLYGTGLGDKFHSGDVFRVDPAGNLTILHRFQFSDGAEPRGRLLQAADGYLYGTSSRGGRGGGGVVYRIDPSATVSVQALSPGSGPAAGGTNLTLTGNHFQPGASLTIGFVSADNVIVTGDTEITASAPALAAAAAYDVRVDNPDGTQATLARGWFTDALDVDSGDLFHDAVRTLFLDGITVGCGGGLYCVDAAVSRAQIAVLLLKAKLGWGYVPPPATGTVFADVAADSFGAEYIEDLASRGISAGCGGSNYCPEAPIRRDEMAPLLLKTLLGPDYVAPPATGTVFDDVPVDAFAADFIEDLFARGFAAGCSLAPPLYCPKAATTRGQMAALIVGTFVLP